MFKGILAYLHGFGAVLLMVCSHRVSTLRSIQPAALASLLQPGDAFALVAFGTAAPLFSHSHFPACLVVALAVGAWLLLLRVLLLLYLRLSNRPFISGRYGA